MERVIVRVVIGVGLVLTLGLVGLGVAWFLEGWDARGLQLRIVNEVALGGATFESVSSVDNGRGAEAYSRGAASQDIDFRTVRFGELESDRNVGVRIDVIDPDGLAFAVLTAGLVCDGMLARQDDGRIRSSAICGEVSEEYVREHRSEYVFHGEPPMPDP